MQMLFTFFFSKNISVYAIFNDQIFNDTLTNDIFSFKQLGPWMSLLSGAMTEDPNQIVGMCWLIIYGFCALRKHAYSNIL